MTVTHYRKFTRSCYRLIGLIYWVHSNIKYRERNREESEISWLMVRNLNGTKNWLQIFRHSIFGPFHQDLIITSPYYLPYISSNVRSENLEYTNLTISRDWSFCFFHTTFLFDDNTGRDKWLIGNTWKWQGYNSKTETSEKNSVMTKDQIEKNSCLWHLFTNQNKGNENKDSCSFVCCKVLWWRGGRATNPSVTKMLVH